MLVSALAALALAVQADATSVNFRGSGRVSNSEVSEILRHEIAGVDGHLEEYEALSQRFASLPKNSYGNLGHQAVRYALHRFFVDRYGWYIDGLEPAAASNASDLPNFLQASFEGQAGDRGVDLHGLMTLAASLEDLAERETQDRVRDAYAANDMPSQGSAPYAHAADVFYTYLISFLIGHNWTISGPVDLFLKQRVFEKRYREYNSTMEWALKVRNQAFGEDKTQNVSFETVATAAVDMGKTYHNYNELGCKDLRSTLKGMEGRRPGRARLSTFYNMSMHGLWDFFEKVEFLRALGALDDSDPKQPSVIIPNYAVSRLNCLNATDVYAICCRNLCDDLTGHLEREIGAPTATAERIAELVSELPSESVAAPRDLPTALVARLHEVAAFHGNRVPLHGRLFTQWMHHAYPLECPFPHEAGIVSVQTPEEWMAQTGEGSQASQEEMRQTVAADACAVSWEGKPDCEEESLELPWSMNEELLFGASGGQAGQSQDGGASTLLALLCLLAAAGVVVWVKAEMVGGQQRWVTLVSLSLAAAAYFADLLDGVVFAGIALVGSATAVGAKFAAGRLCLGKAGCMPTTQGKVA